MADTGADDPSLASARHRFGAELRHWRTARGLSLAALAERALFGKDLICKVEKAQRWPPAGLAEVCDEILATGGVLAGLWTAVRAQRWVQEADLLDDRQARSYRRDEVARLRSDSAVFTSMDHRYGGSFLRWTLERYLHEYVLPLAVQLVDNDVLAAAAVVARKTAMACYDSADGADADRYFGIALSLARRSGDATVVAVVLASMAHHALDTGRPRKAAAYAALAGRHAGTGPLRLAAKLDVLHARAEARMGGRGTAEELVHAAARALEGDTTGEQVWPSTISDAYLAGQIARCHLALGRPDDAAHHAATALAGYPDEQVRRRVLGTCLLAACHVAPDRRSPDPVRAATLGLEALEMASGLRSCRTVEAIRALRSMLAPHHGDPVAAEFLLRTAHWAGSA